MGKIRESPGYESVIILIALTYCFMLYMMERFSYLMNKKYDDELYLEEMKHKEQYYNEVENHTTE